MGFEYSYLQHRRRIIFRTVIQSLVGIPPFIFYVYLLLLGLSRGSIEYSVSHPGFWALLGLILFWFYFFTARSILLIYGLLSYDYATVIGLDLSKCLEHLTKTLSKMGISFNVRKMPRARLIETPFGKILIIIFEYPVSKYLEKEHTILFYNKIPQFLETVNELYALPWILYPRY